MVAMSKRAVRSDMAEIAFKPQAAAAQMHPGLAGTMPSNFRFSEKESDMSDPTQPIPNPRPPPVPPPGPIPDPKPVREPEPGILPDELPNPNPDENIEPPKHVR
jgi:hypothetical protein